MSAGAARRILNSANPREIRALQKTVSDASKTREHSKRDEGAQVHQ